MIVKFSACSDIKFELHYYGLYFEKFVSYITFSLFALLGAILIAYNVPKPGYQPLDRCHMGVGGREDKGYRCMTNATIF